MSVMPLLGRDDLHRVADELERVSVAGDEQHFDTLRLPLLRERAEDVVALPALDLERWARRASSSSSWTMGNCARQLVGGGRPVHLVLLEHLGAERRLAARRTRRRRRRARGPAIILTSIEMKPNAAFVGRPSGAVIVGGSAWNARWMRLLPSIDGDGALASSGGAFRGCRTRGSVVAMPASVPERSDGARDGGDLPYGVLQLGRTDLRPVRRPLAARRTFDRDRRLAHGRTYRQGGSLLDVGGGTGALAVTLGERAGLRASPCSTRRPRCCATSPTPRRSTRSCGSAEAMPFEDRRFRRGRRHRRVPPLPRPGRARCGSSRAWSRAGGCVLIVELDPEPWLDAARRLRREAARRARRLLHGADDLCDFIAAARHRRRLRAAQGVELPLPRRRPGAGRAAMTRQPRRSPRSRLAVPQVADVAHRLEPARRARAPILLRMRRMCTSTVREPP